jgi:hypothetical protein
VAAVVKLITEFCVYLFQIFGVHIKKYPNVFRWLTKAKKEIPKYEELNHAGCLEYKRLYDARTKGK